MLTSIQDHSCCRRDPVKTRETLLQHAFQQIHEYGFQAVSLDAILRDTGVTKGALYHHFPNKNALGYAVVEEVIAPMVDEFWIRPVVQSDGPVQALRRIIQSSGEAMTTEELRMGCPLNNLSQEMSPLDEGFRQRLDAIYEYWRHSLSDAFARGKSNNTVAEHVNPDTTAAFLIAALEGCIGIAKNAQSKEVLDQCGAGILNYLDSLLPDPGEK